MKKSTTYPFGDNMSEEEKREEAFTEYLNAAHVDESAREIATQISAIWLILFEKKIVTQAEAMKFHSIASSRLDQEIAQKKEAAKEALEKEMPGASDIMKMFGFDKML